MQPVVWSDSLDFHNCLPQQDAYTKASFGSSDKGGVQCCRREQECKAGKQRTKKVSLGITLVLVEGVNGSSRSQVVASLRLAIRQ
jgi:hypothetical protein